jgi:kynureninase
MNDSATSLETAQQLDREDPLREFRSQFHIPHCDGQPDIYFVGNSLGLPPKRTEQYVKRELDQWAELGVRGHFSGDLPWMGYHEYLTETMADLVGGQANEVITMNTLTVNLHLMMATFYRPTATRNKILIESHAFPSDKNAVESQIRLHDYYNDSLALVLLPGVQYYTGQVFDMPRIVRVAHKHDIPVGFDLAHAAGNLALRMHDWDVDFACWCTYKYLNSGPGSLSGCFIHERHATNTRLDRLTGWWGHDKATRFQMTGEFSAIPTAEGWQLSNPPILSMAAIRASLDTFKEAGGMEVLNRKSRIQGQFFRDCLGHRLGDRVHVISPADVSGCQLSLEIQLEGTDGKLIHKALESRGVRTDWRDPNVIRAAPTPLYNTFEEIWRFVEILTECLQ